ANRMGRRDTDAAARYGFSRVCNQSGLHAVSRLASERAPGGASARFGLALGDQHQGWHLRHCADVHFLSQRPASLWLGDARGGAGVAIGGVWYALAQHEMKRLLAYHSVENIGIIGLGLAVAWLGRCVGSPGLVALGVAGALLHTLNHAIFKALLFVGVGNVHLHTHTGAIEKLGGLAKALPVTGVVFLIGAVSICGLPPFNGFLSEFLIYKSFFQGGGLMGGHAPLALLVAAVSLAFVGGLAVACFTKLYGVAFLGENRSKTPPHGHEPNSSIPVLVGLATLCGWIGFAPGAALRLVAPAVSQMSGLPAIRLGRELIAPMDELTPVFALLLVMTLLTLVVKIWAQKKAGVRLRETWGCGYQNVTARMQYSASSFAEELVKLGQPLLGLKLHWKPITHVLPEPGTFSSH